MNILSSFVLFDILIIIYEVIVELFSAVFELSGLTKEQARFQVTSLLTGTGFTTSESEKMLATKKRKRVTRDIMIISYIFNISIISTLISLFTSAHISTFDDIVYGLLLSLILLAALVFSKRITTIRNFIDKTFLALVGLIYYKRENPVIIYDYYGSRVLAEVKINKMPHNLENKEFKEISFKDKYNIDILSIKRGNKVIIDFNKKTKLLKKDSVLLVGSRSRINKVFQK